jgi:hypothetical protein
MKIRTNTKTISYKGGIIKMEYTDLDWRNQCELHKSVLCWFNTEGYHGKRVIINNFPSFQPSVTLKYIRNRINEKIN